MTTRLVPESELRKGDNPHVFLGDVTCDACGHTVRISLEEGASAIVCGSGEEGGCGEEVVLDPDGSVLVQIIDRGVTPEVLTLMDEVTTGVTLMVRHLPPMMALLVLAERVNAVADQLGMTPESAASFVAQGFAPGNKPEPEEEPWDLGDAPETD